MQEHKDMVLRLVEANPGGAKASDSRHESPYPRGVVGVAGPY